MKLVTIALIALVAVTVLLVMLSKGNDGTATPTLSIAPGVETMEIPSDINCINAQECVDYSLEQDPTQNVEARCEASKCTFIIEKFPSVEVAE